MDAHSYFVVEEMTSITGYFRLVVKSGATAKVLITLRYNFRVQKTRIQHLQFKRFDCMLSVRSAISGRSDIVFAHRTKRLRDAELRGLYLTAP